MEPRSGHAGASVLTNAIFWDWLEGAPCVRPAGAAHGDQARVVTPAGAVAAGATHIVVGRPITTAPDPVAVAKKILKEIA